MTHSTKANILYGLDEVVAGNGISPPLNELLSAVTHSKAHGGRLYFLDTPYAESIHPVYNNIAGLFHRIGAPKAVLKREIPAEHRHYHRLLFLDDDFAKQEMQKNGMNLTQLSEGLLVDVCAEYSPAMHALALKNDCIEHGVTRAYITEVHPNQSVFQTFKNIFKNDARRHGIYCEPKMKFANNSWNLGISSLRLAKLAEHPIELIELHSNTEYKK